MGRGNYDCMLDIEPGTDDLKLANEALENIGTVARNLFCFSAPCKFTKGFKCSKMNPVSAMGEWDFGVPPENLCDYFSSLTKAQNSMYFVGNTAYLMAMNQSGKILKNDHSLLWTKHQLANNMMSFYSLNISQRVLEKIFKAPSLKEIQSEKSEMKKKTLQKQREVITKIFDVKDASPCFGIPKIPSVSLQTTADERKAGLQILGRYLLRFTKRLKRGLRTKTHTQNTIKRIGLCEQFRYEDYGLARLYCRFMGKLGLSIGRQRRISFMDFFQTS